MPEHMPDNERISRELQRKRLTFIQRRRHLDRIERLIAEGRDELDRPERPGRAEFGVLIATLLVLFAGLALWSLLPTSAPSDSLGDSGMAGNASAALPTARRATIVADVPPIVTPGYDAESGICHVTPLAVNVDPVVPRDDVRYLRWYGSHEAGLWAAPQDFGAFLPTAWPQPASLWFAGAETPVRWYGGRSTIMVERARLDGYTRFRPDLAAWAYGGGQASSITIPEPGCWQLTATAGAQELTIVIEVLPLDRRPDIAIAESYVAARPYAIPSTCPVTARSRPEQRGAGHHWLQSGDIRAEFADLLFADEEQSVGVVGADVVDGLTLTARKLNTDTDEAELALTPLWNSDARLALFSIPSDGCWELELETPTTTVTFVVYVYPGDCKPELRDGAFVSEC